jgi:hypothetical protein
VAKRTSRGDKTCSATLQIPFENHRWITEIRQRRAAKSSTATMHSVQCRSPSPAVSAPCVPYPSAAAICRFGIKVPGLAPLGGNVTVRDDLPTKGGGSRAATFAGEELCWTRPLLVPLAAGRPSGRRWGALRSTAVARCSGETGQREFTDGRHQPVSVAARSARRRSFRLAWRRLNLVRTRKQEGHRGTRMMR